jgi:hypothetical protein
MAFSSTKFYHYSKSLRRCKEFIKASSSACRLETRVAVYYDLLEIGGHSELVSVLSDSGLRVAVEEKARTFGCLDAISNLAIIDAVRFLQQKERYTPCFGGESPLVPLLEAPKLCGVLECYWKLPCDTHRIAPAASLEACMNEEVVRNMEETILAPVPPAPKDETSAVAGEFEEQSVADIVGRVADSAGALVAAVRDLAQRSAGWNGTVRRQLAGLTDRFGQLAEVVFEQQVVNAVTHERHEQLSTAVASLEAADARRGSEVEALRGETRERTNGFSRHLEELSSRLRLQQEDFAGFQAKLDSLTHLQSTVAELGSRVDVWCERLDRQGDVLHRLCEEQTQRAAALDQFLVVLSKLRTSTVSPPAPAPDA